jgi:hypothetical protein
VNHKTILLTAAVALGVVIAHDKLKTGAKLGGARIGN